MAHNDKMRQVRDQEALLDGDTCNWAMHPSPHDYGAMVFLDDRFCEAQHSAKLSKWIRPRFQADATTRDALASLSSFFASHQQQ